jgi:histone acetyltransferase (RNA polymerase elongator complex component)
MEKNHHTIVPLFLTHLGCRERCTYCDQSLIAGPFDEEDLSRTVDVIKSRPGKVEVGLFAGNIFGVEPARLEWIFEALSPVREKIAAFRASTKPVMLREETMALMKRYGVTTIELGIPSFNDEILKALNRGHTVQDLLRAYRVLREVGFAVALQVMVGLPGELAGDLRDMAGYVEALRPAYLRIYPLVILKGTPLCSLFDAGGFVPVSFEEGLLRAVYLYLSAISAGVKVVKIGLTRNELVEEKVAGGFYHPAFGYLVRSEAFFLALKQKIAEASFKGHVGVAVHRRDVPHVVGYKRANLKRLAEEGITVTCEVCERTPDSFRISNGSLASEGTVFDALPSLQGTYGRPSPHDSMVSPFTPS